MLFYFMNEQNDYLQYMMATGWSTPNCTCYRDFWSNNVEVTASLEHDDCSACFPNHSLGYFAVSKIVNSQEQGGNKLVTVTPL